jgi:hypothetical protein
MKNVKGLTFSEKTRASFVRISYIMTRNSTQAHMILLAVREKGNVK